MKKLLALVLALVMTLGLATVGANAATTAYKDADKINYKEAVDVMSAIGILAGDETGFRPTDNLKRSEGAKIIAYMLLGNKAADSLSGSGAKFSDVPANHWAAGYIEYLAAQGVIGGVGDGKFDPDGTLTTVQFAKMLLVALGYDASIEKLVGADWSINTQKLANQTDIKLFKGNNEVSANKAITREEAALYAFNALRTPLVQYENKGTSINVNGASITTGASNVSYKTDTVAKNQKISNKRLNEGMAGAAATPFLVEFAEFYYPDLELVGQDEGQDDLGRPIRKWTWKSAEIGKYAMSGWLVKTWEKKVTAKDVYDAIGKSTYDAVVGAKWNATSGRLDGTTITIHEDGVNKQDGQRTNQEGNSPEVLGGPINAAFAMTSAILDPYVSRTDTNKVNNSGNGTVTELYQDDDNNLILVTYHTYLYKVAGGYQSSSGTTTITYGNDKAVQLEETKIKETDFPQVKDLKDGDYVVCSVYKTTNTSYKVASIAKAELLTGKVEKYNTDGDELVVLDGTTYKYSNMADDEAKATHYTVGQKATVVLDGHGSVIYVDEAHATDDYVFVKEWGSSSSLKGDARAAIVLPDGTEKEVEVKSVEDPSNGGKRVTSKETISGWGKTTNVCKWFSYSKDAEGKYAFYAPETKYAQTDKTNYAYSALAAADNRIAQNNKAQFLDNIVPQADDKTIVIVKQNDKDLQIFTGVKNSPDIDLKVANALGDGAAEAYVLYNKNTTYARFVYIKVTGEASVSGGSGANLVYVIKYNTKTTGADNEVWHEYKTVVDGAKSTSLADAKIAGGKYYPAFFVTKNSKDQLTGFDMVETNIDGTTLNGGAGQSSRASSVYGSTGRNQTSISYNDGVISLGNWNFPVNNSTKLTLVVLGGKDYTSRIMNGDKAADEEITYGTGSTAIKNIISVFKNYDVTFGWAVKTTGSDSKVAEEILITVSAAQQSTSLTFNKNTFFKGGAVDGSLTKALADSGNKVTVNGNVTIDQNYTIPATATVTFSGNVTVKDGFTLTNNGNVTIKGNLIVGDTSTPLAACPTGFGVTNGGTLRVNGFTYNYGDITNNSTMTLIGAAYDYSKCITNNGTLTTNALVLDGGSVTNNSKMNVNETLTIKSGGELTYGAAGEGEIHGNVALDNGKIDASAAATDKVVISGNVEVGKNGTLDSTGNSIKVTGKNLDIKGTVTGTVNISPETEVDNTSGKAVDTNVVYETEADTKAIALKIVL